MDKRSSCVSNNLSCPPPPFPSCQGTYRKPARGAVSAARREFFRFLSLFFRGVRRKTEREVVWRCLGEVLAMEFGDEKGCWSRGCCNGINKDEGSTSVRRALHSVECCRKIYLFIYVFFFRVFFFFFLVILLENKYYTLLHNDGWLEMGEWFWSF